MQLNYTNTINIDKLIMLNTEDANDINLQITASASNTKLGSIIRDGEIEDLSTSTQRNITKLYSSATQVSSSGTGEDDLMTYTLPADWMGKTGVLHIKASGTITGSNGNKTIKFYFGATAYTLHTAANNTGDWSADIYIYQHTDRATQALDILVYHGSAVLLNDHATGAVTTTSTVAIKLTGECADAGDTITQNTMLIEGY